MQTYAVMIEHFNVVGWTEAYNSLYWWGSIQYSGIMDFGYQKLYPAPLLIEAASAYHSMQTSSASAEPFFGDACFQEDSRRQDIEITL